MMKTREHQLVRFDWAIKHLLRDRANFDVLEGFLGALLEEEVRVTGLLDTESDREAGDLKYNRVDIMVEDGGGRRFIVEVQNSREHDYLQRLLFGTCRVVTDTLEIGRPYNEIVKVISVSILYFNLGGSGNDYVYHGSTAFRGLHTGGPLRLRRREKLGDRYVLREVSTERDIFPEYYLINVERFEDQIRTPLDEWTYMLKHESVRDDFRSRNIGKAREKLAVMKMTPEKRRAYEKYMMDIVSERDIMKTARDEGRNEGRKETARNMLREGLDVALIAKVAGLSLEEIQALADDR